MTYPDRRKFLQLTALMVGTGPLIGCGGASGGGDDHETASGVPADDRAVALREPTASLSVADAVTSANAAAACLMQFTLTRKSAPQSSRSGARAAQPFTLGYAFRRGDIPAGNTVISNFGQLQVTPRNYWPDGSMKFAQLAGLVALPTNEPVTVLLSGSDNHPSGVALTLADLKRTGVTARIAGGSFGAADWTGAAWDTPFRTWVSGPLLSSWVYRKPIGIDAHLVAWLEVRLWANGAVEVLPWVENGYIAVPSPTNKSATYSFTLGATQRFSAAIDLKHHQRTPLVSGQALAHWLGADPGVVPQPDAAYLQATELVPTYSATVAADAALVSALPASYTPLQQGSFTYAADSMPAPGFAEPIGLLPQHDMIGLVTTASTFAAVVRNGYSAGRYPIHYRDEATLKPVVPLDRPGMCIPDGRGIYAAGGAYAGGTTTPAPSGGNGPTWDTAHCPSVGYMAYLLTGSFFHMETAQFAAAINYLGRANLAVQRGRSGEGFLIVDPGSVGVRDCAWAWRTLAQAITATPDVDAWRAAWAVVAQNNIDHYHSRYVAQANNPLGYIQAGTAAYDGTLATVAPWQNDFLTAAWGYSAVLGLPLAAGYQAKLEAFFAFTAKSITHRLGENWHWQNPATYTARISGVQAPNWVDGSGPWHTAAEAYAVTFAGGPGWLANTSGNTLGDENLPGSAPAAMRSFLGNLVPAISYAVRLGVTDAAACYARLTGADNQAILAQAQNSYPGWAVAPGSQPASQQALPAWRVNAPLNGWISIAGTAGAAGSDVDAFCGWGFKSDTSDIYVLAAGGHTNSGNNQVSRLRLLDDVPTWGVRRASDWNGIQVDVAFYASGSPAARHTYHTTRWVQSLNRFLLVAAPYTKGTAVSFPNVVGYDPAREAWDVAGTYADVLGIYGPGSAYGFGVSQDASGNIWTNHNRRYNSRTNVWDAPTITNLIGGNAPQCHCPKLNIMFSLQWGNGEAAGSGIAAYKRAMGTLTDSAVTFSPGSAAAVSQFISDKPAYAGMDWDASNDRFLFYQGGTRVYVITPNAGTEWEIALLTTTGTAPGAAPVGGINSKFTYVPALGGFVAMPSSAGGVFFLRTT